MHPLEQISVHVTYSVSFCDLPEPIHAYVHEVCCEWGIGSGEQLSFESLLEYLEDHDKTEERKAVQDFMNKNDLEDSYCIDLDW